MTALALQPAGLWLPERPALILPRRLKRAMKAIKNPYVFRMEGQFAPYQPIQFEETISAPQTPAAITSISLHDTATSTASTITAPADIEAGDLILLYDWNRGGGASAVVPTGFTLIRSENPRNTTNTFATTSYKIAAGSEGGTSITGQTGSTWVDKMMAVFRPNVPAVSATINDSSYGHDGGSGTADPPDQTINVNGEPAPFIVYGCMGTYTTTGTTTGTMTLGGSATADGTISASSRTDLMYKVVNAALSNDIVLGMNDPGDGNHILGAYITLSPT